MTNTRMSMFVRRFLVQPNNSFETVLRESSSGLASVLSQKVLWTHKSGRRSLQGEELVKRNVKATHVCNIINEYVDDPDFTSLLGRPEKSLEFFDACWEIDQVDDDESIEDVIARLTSADKEWIEAVTKS